MKVHVKPETFEGPLDLLLHLIDKAEVDIYEVSISEVTGQYLAYLEQLQELELEVASEFLVMAATLLYIKSRELLPKPPLEPEWEEFESEYQDPREELIRQLVEYRKYKTIAGELREKEQARSLIYTKEPEDLTPFLPQIKENPVKGLHVSDLILAFQKALRRAQSRHTVTRIRRDEISVKDRIGQVLDVLQEARGQVLFSRLVSEDSVREEIVVTFLAVLELMKRKLVVCYQHRLFEDIVIQAREGTETSGFAVDEIDY